MSARALPSEASPNRPRPPLAGRRIPRELMEPTTHAIDASNHRLRRVGRIARRRLRIDGADLTNGIHTDGRLSVVISGLDTADEGRPEMFQWWSDRPVALVIIRSSGDGGDVAFTKGPVRWGTGVRWPGDRRNQLRRVLLRHRPADPNDADRWSGQRSPRSWPDCSARPRRPDTRLTPTPRRRSRRTPHPTRPTALEARVPLAGTRASGFQIPTIDRIAIRGPRAGGLIPLASRSRMTRPR